MGTRSGLARALGIAITLSWPAASIAAQEAEAPRARLRYEPPDASCPDEQSLRDAVSARLGRDPFGDDASTTIVARIERTGRTYEGAIQVLGSEGELRGSRRVAAAEPDCEELGRALALAISVAIDPLSLTRAATPEPEPEPAPEPQVEPEAAPEVEAPPPSPECPEVPAPRPLPSVRAELAVGVHAAIEAAPAPTVGGTLAVGVRIDEIVSVAAEGRIDAPQSLTARDGRVSAHFVGAALVPCGHVWWVSLCGIATLGALRGEGSEVDEPRRAETLFAMAGARVAIDAPLARWAALRVLADVQATLTPTTLELDGRGVYEMAPASATIGARAVFWLPE